MDSILKNKRLLVLGGTRDEIPLVKRAQEFGVYVIVTDYNKDRKISPAKNIANEAWDISWKDVDLIVQMCRSSDIDGVIAGYSEIKIEYLIKICKELGLPCYSTEEQLEITRDKVKFKAECRKNGVPTVKEYSCIDGVDAFPVIVKPTDRAGSIGVSIAYNQKELKESYDYAMEQSLTKHVIIEQYMTCQKVDVYYAVEDGVIDPMTTNDTIMAANNYGTKVVQSAWLYPQRYEENFFNKCDKSLRKMIKGMGIKYGCIFFSGFIDDNKDYSFFECGFRLEGAHQYEYTFRKGKFNYLDLFIFHALTGKTDGMPRNESENTDLKLVELNFYAKGGVISEISGFDTALNDEDCSLSLELAYVGQKCDSANAILQKLGMVGFTNEDSGELMRKCSNAYHTVKVFDDGGNDMIYDRIDTSLIEHWWD